MADDRIKDLPGEVLSGELNALIETLYLAVDDTTFTDAEKVLWKSLLKNTPLTSGTDDYQAITPKAIWDSLMTDAVRGIGQFSTDENVESKSGTGLLNSLHQVLMQVQWLKDWFQSNGVPAIYTADDLATPRTMSFQVDFNQAVNPSPVIVISPTLPAGYRFDVVSFSYAAWENAANKGFGFDGVIYTGSVVTYILDTVLRLQLSADGRELSLSASTPLSVAYASLKFNAIIVAI